MVKRRGEHSGDPDRVSGAQTEDSTEAALELPPGEEGIIGESEPPRSEGAQAPEYKDRWLRAEADLQNYRRRAQRDLEETRRGSEERVMLEIIAALDDLERAIEASRAAKVPEAHIQGVQLVANRLNEYLARQGVTSLSPVGERFDPNVHEALLEVDPPEGIEPGHVVQVALKGYKRGDRALRPARVVVARRQGDL